MSNALSSKVKFITNRIRQQNLFRQVSEYFQSVDTKHLEAWDSYGYKNELQFLDFYTMFSRFGVARACIMMTVDKCWQTHPQICSDEEDRDRNEWERQVDQFISDRELWHRLKGLDWRQRLSRYAGLVMFVRDGETLDKPLEGKFRPDSLAELRPVVEYQLYPTVWDEDQTSIRYGQPVMYQYNEQEYGDKNNHSGRSVNIHWTRVIPWAEGADDGTQYGIPALESVFNSLVTLERLIGAGGTGFWKAARQSLQINFDPQADLNALAASLGTDMNGLADELNDQVDDWNKGFDKVLTLQGAEAKSFDFKMPDSDKLFNNSMSDVAAGMNVPMTVLIGQQTGRLASDEDQSEWTQVNESRRENFLSPAIVKTLDRFIELGFLSPPPGGKIYVKWDPLQEPSPSDKLERSKSMATVNKELLGTGQGVAFTIDEIRAEYGKDPLEEDDAFGEIEEVPGKGVDTA